MDGIIIAILVVVLFFALRASVKHFARKSGCCGGGDYKMKKKRLCKVLYKKTFAVEGMHCESCKRRVEEAVNNIIGVSGSVNLKKGELTVSYESDVDDEIIISKLRRLGYAAKTKNVN